ncbi:MAG: DNA-directed RNA polymerase subunit omega [Ilumatobacter sp.]|jgi:DNA-directed RNA polymerase subunit omega
MFGRSECWRGVDWGVMPGSMRGLMALDNDTMIDPPIETLLGKVDSKFTLVTLAARRARNINSYFNQLGEGLGHMIPPQVSSTAHKPLSMAFEEIAANKIVWTEAPEPAEEIMVEEDPEAEAQAAADAAVDAKS